MHVDSIEGPAFERPDVQTNEAPERREDPHQNGASGLRRLAGLVVAMATLTVATAGTSAQDRPTNPDASTPEVSEESQQAVRHSAREHSRTRSLSLFASVDTDSDDRLDIFEFEVGFGAIEDRAIRFREIDLDRDGWIDGFEFDARYRSQIERRSEFTVFSSRPIFPLRDPAAPELSIDPRRLIIRSIDFNEDEVVQKSEFGRFLREVRLSQDLAEQFTILDLDRSGALDVDEFGTIAENIPGVLDRARNQKDPRSSLPLDDRAADSNLDGVLDRSEIEDSLRLIHPSLGVHANRVLDDADRANDRRLGGPELFQSRKRARDWLGRQTEQGRAQGR